MNWDAIGVVEGIGAVAVVASFFYLVIEALRHIAYPAENGNLPCVISNNLFDGRPYPNPVFIGCCT